MFCCGIAKWTKSFPEEPQRKRWSFMLALSIEYDTDDDNNDICEVDYIATETTKTLDE